MTTPGKITSAQAREVAALARLDLPPDELARLTGQLDQILGYVAQLDALDTTGVEPTTHVMPLSCPQREDREQPSPVASLILGQAPESDGEHFVVPKIID